MQNIKRPHTSPQLLPNTENTQYGYPKKKTFKNLLFLHTKGVALDCPSRSNFAVSFVVSLKSREHQSFSNPFSARSPCSPSRIPGLCKHIKLIGHDIRWDTSFGTVVRRRHHRCTRLCWYTAQLRQLRGSRGSRTT